MRGIASSHEAGVRAIVWLAVGRPPTGHWHFAMMHVMAGGMMHSYHAVVSVGCHVITRMLGVGSSGCRMGLLNTCRVTRPPPDVRPEVADEMAEGRRRWHAGGY